jgi:hypothetical protein
MSNQAMYRCNHEWATRPDDERYLNLDDTFNHFVRVREQSRELTYPSRRLDIRATDDDDMVVRGIDRDGPDRSLSNWSFQQLATLSGSPAGYLKTLHPKLAAACATYKLQNVREAENVKLLLRDNDGVYTLPAATGERYGRVWDADFVDAVRNRVGNGVSGDWRVPGEFGKPVPITRQNTTLYASDRDLFIFLCDEVNKIEVPARRNGKPGLMSRGFFAWNSSLGSTSYGIACFLFDYVCQNRCIWGLGEYSELRFRHIASAPDQFLDKMMPALDAYRNGSSGRVLKLIDGARNAHLDKEKTDDFLRERFGGDMVEPLKLFHQTEEERPIESLWDASTAATAYARTINHTNERVALERKAGAILDLAAA